MNFIKSGLLRQSLAMRVFFAPSLRAERSEAWQSTFNKALNSVKSNLLFVDCFGLCPRNDGERDCLAFSMPRNDDYILSRPLCAPLATAMSGKRKPSFRA